MKTLKRRILSFITVTALILGIIGALPGAVIFGPTIKAKADASSVSFDESTGTLTLKRGNIVKADVQVYANDNRVRTVIAEEGAVLPEDCSSLFAGFKAASMNLNGVDTSNVSNMHEMFYECENLNTLDVSSFDTGNVTDMGDMFSMGGHNEGNLQSLDLSSFDTSKVTDMAYMFYNCTSLVNLNLSSFDTSKVTDMEGMFDDCTSIVNLDVSGFNTSRVTSMGYMFNGCQNNSAIDLSGFETKNVTDMSLMFYYSEFEALDLSGFNTEKVTDMHYMFASSDVESSIDLSSFKLCDGVDIGNMFHDSSVETVYVSQNWDLSKTKDGGIGDTRVFQNCYYLEGGNGTQYSNEHIDKSYAHIDGENNNPGYFTAKNPTAYNVVFNSMGGTRIDKQSVTSGSSATRPVDDPERTGCSFDGWFTSDGTRFDFDTTITEPTFLYAKWTEPTLVPATEPVNCATPGNIKHYTKDGKYYIKRGNRYTEVTAADVAVSTPHSVTTVPAAPATCTTDGNILYYECSTCGKKFTNQAGTNEITDDSWRIPASHTLEFVDESAATCTSDGTGAHFKCTVCEDLFTNDTGLDAAKTTLEELKINKLGHNYVNGKCDRCGADDPDYNPVNNNTPVYVPSTPDPEPAPVSNTDIRIYKNEDGSVTTKTTARHDDGSVTSEEKTEFEDGSYTLVSETKDKDGKILTKTEETKTISKKGTATVTTNTVNADGSTLEKTVKTTKKGHVETSTVVSEATKKGNTLVTVTMTNSDGYALSMGFTVKKGTVTLTSFEATEGIVTIPNEITVNGETIPVAAILKAAFKNNTDITNVSIGKNVTVIGTKAFYGAKNLNKIFIYSNLEKVAKGAFKKIAEDALIKIKADKENYKRIVELIKASGVGKGVKFKRIK